MKWGGGVWYFFLEFATARDTMRVYHTMNKYINKEGTNYCKWDKRLITQHE